MPTGGHSTADIANLLSMQGMLMRAYSESSRPAEAAGHAGAACGAAGRQSLARPGGVDRSGWRIADHQRCRGLQAIDRFRPPVPPLAIGAVGNVGNGTLSPDVRTNTVRIVAFVGNDHGTLLKTGEQRFGAGNVMHLAGRDQEADGAAFRVDPRVDLRAEASSASPHTTISTLFFTPEAC